MKVCSGDTFSLCAAEGEDSNSFVQQQGLPGSLGGSSCHCIPGRPLQFGNITCWKSPPLIS
jgi:hypothetical protein